MPYVNIPDSGLGGVVALIVGKIQGKLSAAVLKQATNITNSLNTDGCPTGTQLKRLRNQKQQLDNALSQIDGKLSKFKALPGKLKPPVNGLKAALKIILLLPIPQSVPPGFGLPINITTKYADLMHLLKEFIKQIGELISSIEVVLDTPTSSLDAIKSNLSRADNALRTCEIQSALNNEIQNGNISKDELISTGLYDTSGNFILSGLGTSLLANTSNQGLGNTRNQSNSDKRFRGKWQNGVNYKKDDIVLFDIVKYLTDRDHLSNIKGDQNDGPPKIGPWTDIHSSEKASIDILNTSLSKLNDSNINQNTKDNIKKLLDNFKTPTAEVSKDSKDFYHTGPDGTVYKLEILFDPNSPQIAPRRFAIASTLNGVVKFKGPKSFSSSTQVLLDEIKFRIDNQLP